MTCKEKLRLEHPEYVSDEYIGGCDYCPCDFGYLDLPLWCPISNDELISDDLCRVCWNREIPELNNNAEFKDSNTHPLTPNESPEILDSGDRTRFESGAVRDMHEGKGRCDLLPLDVLGSSMGDDVLVNISTFMHTAEVRFLWNALIVSNIFDDTYTMILEVAKHFEDGCKKYGENNWRKGIPVKFYIDSGVRHYLKYRRGDTDERHDRAFVWNLLCAMWTQTCKPELAIEKEC